MHGRGWVTMGLLAWALGASALHAAEHPDVAVGRSAYQQGDFPAALAALEAAARNPQLTEEDLVALHWTRAACHHALGQEQDTARELDAVLVLRPLHEADPLETPPPLRAQWQARRDAWEAAHGVTVGAPTLEGAVLVVPLSGHVDEVADVLVHLRAPGEPVFRAAVLAALGGQARGTPLDAPFWSTLPTGAVELVLEARNRRGVVVARRGHALSPVVLDLDDAQRAALVTALTPPPPAPALPAPPPPSAVAAPPEPAPIVIPPGPGPAALHPSSAVVAATAWTAYGSAAVALGVLGVMLLVALVVPPLGALMAPSVGLAALGMATATWVVAQRYGRWRSPLGLLVAGAVTPALACVLPISVLGGTCLSVGVVANPFVGDAVRDVDPRNLWLIYPFTVLGCACFSGPLVVATVVGMLGGAAVTSFLATEFGRPMDADDDTLHMDLETLPRVEPLDGDDTR